MTDHSQTLRVLTVPDIHQSQTLYRQLAEVIQLHKPDVVALVGDFLAYDAISSSDLLSVEQAAKALSSLPVSHLLLVRGNHEQENWAEFVYSWPFERRPLVALYGSAFRLGPLAIVGFPCHLGWEDPWCETLPEIGNEISLDHVHSNRKALPADHQRWLPQLLRQIGPAGRTLWLMHEPPMPQPIATPQTFNQEWMTAVENFRPLLVVSGHDHETPKRFNAWHSILGDSLCLNPGQSATELHYCLLDFDFVGSDAALPRRVTVEAFPWKTKVIIPLA